MSGQRFRTHPVEVDAIQYRPDLPNCDEVAAFVGEEPRSACQSPHPDAVWRINESQVAVCGDWIIRLSDGFHVCPPDLFADAYVEVDR